LDEHPCWIRFGVWTDGLDERTGDTMKRRVYEASGLRLHRRVAAKVMMGSLFGDSTALRRFEREARAALGSTIAISRGYTITARWALAARI